MNSWAEGEGLGCGKGCPAESMAYAKALGWECVHQCSTNL